jgi:IS5 family transposase
MPRIYFLQQWLNLSDPGVEEALYDSATMREFVGIDLDRKPAPDATTIRRFRHLLEARDLGRRLFEEVHRHLEANGVKVATGASSTRPSSTPRRRRTTSIARATPTCARPARAINGISA